VRGGHRPIVSNAGRSGDRIPATRRSVEDNLASLGVERLAVVNLRRLDISPGLLATGDQVVDLDDQPAVLAAARTLGVTPSQVGLAWLLQHAPNILLISGTSSIGHLRENAAAAEISIPADLIAGLEAWSPAVVAGP